MCKIVERWASFVHMKPMYQPGKVKYDIRRLSDEKAWLVLSKNGVRCIDGAFSFQNKVFDTADELRWYLRCTGSYKKLKCSVEFMYWCVEAHRCPTSASHNTIQSSPESRTSIDSDSSGFESPCSIKTKANEADIDEHVL